MADNRALYEPIAREFARQYGIDEDVFVRQINKESGWNPMARGAAGELGLAQFMPGTAKAVGLIGPRGDRRGDPKASLEAGARHMRQLLDSFGGDLNKALMAYNAGAGAVQRNRVPRSAQAYAASLLQTSLPSQAVAQASQLPTKTAARTGSFKTTPTMTDPDADLRARWGGGPDPSAIPGYRVTLPAPRPLPAPAMPQVVTDPDTDLKARWGQGLEAAARPVNLGDPHAREHALRPRPRIPGPPSPDIPGGKIGRRIVGGIVTDEPGGAVERGLSRFLFGTEDYESGIAKSGLHVPYTPLSAATQAGFARGVLTPLNLIPGLGIAALGTRSLAARHAAQLARTEGQLAKGITRAGRGAADVIARTGDQATDVQVPSAAAPPPARNLDLQAAESVRTRVAAEETAEVARQRANAVTMRTALDRKRQAIKAAQAGKVPPKVAPEQPVGVPEAPGAVSPVPAVAEAVPPVPSVSAAPGTTVLDQRLTALVRDQAGKGMSRQVIITRLAKQGGISRVEAGRVVDQALAQAPAPAQVVPEAKVAAEVAPAVEDDLTTAAAKREAERRTAREVLEQAPATVLEPEAPKTTKQIIQEVKEQNKAARAQRIAQAAKNGDAETEVADLRQSYAKMARQASGGRGFKRVVAAVPGEIPEVAGGATFEDINFWDSLEEISDKTIGPGTSNLLVRARTIHERLFARITDTLNEVWNPRDLVSRFRRIRHPLAPPLNAVQDQSVYDLIVGNHPAVTDAKVMEAQNALQTINRMRGTPVIKDIMATVKGSVDSWKIGRMSDPDLMTDLMTANPGLTAPDARVLVKDLKAWVDQNKAASEFMLKKNLTPSYGLMRPMHLVVPHYISSATKAIGVKESIGDPNALARLAIKTGHPEAKQFVELFNRWLGKEHVMPTDIMLRDAANVSNSLAAIAFLGWPTAVKQLSQSVFAMAGTRTQAGISPIKFLWNGVAKSLTPAGRTEARLNAAWMTNMQALTGEFMTNIERNGSGWKGLLSAGADITQHVAGKTLGASLVPQVDSFMRSATFNAKYADYRRLYDLYRKGQAWAGDFLVREGVNLKATNLFDEMQMVAKEFSDRVNLRTDILSAPQFLTSPKFQFARGLNMFSWVITKHVYKEFMNPAFHKGQMVDAAGRIAKMAGYGAAVGTLIMETDRFLKNKERPQDWAGRLAEAWGAIGMFGLSQHLINGVVDAQGSLIEAGKIPGHMARNWEEMVKGLATGAGLGFVAELPLTLLSKRRSRITPVVGSIYYGHVVKGNEDQSKGLKRGGVQRGVSRKGTVRREPVRR